jgi:hypothetical protein
MVYPQDELLFGLEGVEQNRSASVFRKEKNKTKEN